MASHRYIGYVGRLAVAVGVGAAVAVAGQGVAHAETESASSASESAGAVDAGPKKPDAAKDHTADESDDTKDPSDEAADKDSDAEPSPGESLTKKLRQSAQQFEADQIQKLRSVFTPRAIEPDDDTDSEPKTKRDTTSDDEPADEGTEARLAEEPTAKPVQKPTDEPAALAAAEPAPWSPDPFRPDDPEPDGVPSAVLAIRDAILRAPIDPRVKPVIREGMELAYRISQVAPVANVPVPVYKIIPALAEAARGDRAGAQVIVNQALLTTQPIALLYYGYDEIADLLNMESEARERKEEFYRTAWDSLDPLSLLHVRGDHGLRD